MSSSCEEGTALLRCLRASVAAGGIYNLMFGEGSSMQCLGIANLGEGRIKIFDGVVHRSFAVGADCDLQAVFFANADFVVDVASLRESRWAAVATNMCLHGSVNVKRTHGALYSAPFADDAIVLCLESFGLDVTSMDHYEFSDRQAFGERPSSLTRSRGGEGEARAPPPASTESPPPSPTRSVPCLCCPWVAP